MKKSTRNTIIFIAIIFALLYFTSFKPLAFVSPENNGFLMVAGTIGNYQDPNNIQPPLVASELAVIGPYTISTSKVDDHYRTVLTDECRANYPESSSWRTTSDWDKYRKLIPSYISVTEVPGETFINSAGVSQTCPKTRYQVSSKAEYKSGGRWYTTPINGMDATYGGRVINQIWESNQCFQKATVTKNGVVVYADKDYTRESTVFRDDNIAILFFSTSYTNSGGTCYHVDNIITYNIPQNAVNITVEELSPQVFEGSAVKTTVVIDNEWDYDLEADIIVDFEIPTGLLNPSTEKRNQTVHLVKGINKFDYTIPTSGSTTSLKVTPHVKFYVSPTIFSGVNTEQYPFNQQTPVSSYTRISVGSYDAPQQTVRINTKPLYLEKPIGGCSALTGYIDGKGTNYCVRDDLATISCLQLGCPAFQDYTCTSAGVCAQVITKLGCSKDADCAGLGGVCETNNNGVAYCVNTVIREVVKEITVEHNNTILVVDQLFTSVDQGCDSFNYCAEGYKCVDRTVNGNPIAYCQDNRGNIIEQIINWISNFIQGLFK